jgi:ABC-2 type transport system permease protein
VKGLIIKDFLVLKKTGRVFLMILGLYLVMTIFMNTDMGPLMVFICGMLSISTFAYDEQAKWDSFALTMPISKRDLVRSKYVLAVILCFIGAMAGVILSVASNLDAPFIDWSGILMASGIALCASYLFNSLALPLLYKFGAEKSRVILLACYAVPLIGASLVMNELEKSSGALLRLQSLLNLGAILLPFVTIAVLFVSYLISLRIYEKKDV